MRHHTLSISGRVSSTAKGAPRVVHGFPCRQACSCWIATLGWCLVLLLTSITTAEPDTSGTSPLEAAFQAMAKLEVGQNLSILHPIELAVVKSANDESLRADLETRFIEVLTRSATDLGKQVTCRQLTLMGSDQAIPALSECLSDPSLSYMARYALEGIGGPAATAALRTALSQTKGTERVGLVISLGRLADAKSVPLLTALMDEEDPQLGRAICVALGRIGTIDAVKVLDSCPTALSAEVGEQVIDARLRAAEHLIQSGQFKAAAGIGQSLASHDSERIQAAAFRVLIKSQPSESAALMISGLASEQAWKRTVAADCLADVNDTKVISVIATALPELPPAGCIAALDSLQACAEPSVRQAALELLDNENPSVQAAALTALITAGTAEDVPQLAHLINASDQPQVREAASETLRLMSAEGVNQALGAWMQQQQQLDATIVRVANRRRSPQLVPALFQAAEAGNQDTRLEALQALEIMATGEDAARLVAILCNTSPGAEREAADRAVWMACQKISDPAQRSAPLIAAMEEMEAAGKCAVLPTLARIGGDESLKAVRAAMQSDNAEVKDAGYRALANWPDATVADQLLHIAKTSDVESYRIWSLRAFARVVALPSERPPQATFEMLETAMGLASRTEDKQLVISRLGSVRVPTALTYLLNFIEADELREAAVPAVYACAKGISQTHPDLARQALKTILPLTDDPALQQQIPKVLRDIEDRTQNQP